MPKKVLILTDNPSPVLDIKKVCNFLSEYFNDVEYGGELISWLSLNREGLDGYEENLKSIRVLDIENPLTHPTNEYQDKTGKNIGISSDPNKVTGDLYDGYWLQRHLFSLINSESQKNLSEYSVIIITGKLFGTFEGKRYHARVVLLGCPHIVSTSGVVEAPARPPEYYWIMAGMLRSDSPVPEIDKFLGDKYLTYDDPRIDDTICSYLLQPLLYDLTGSAFCENTKCCIHNSHWQKEVLEVQYKQKLCEKCSRILKSVKSRYAAKT